MLEEREETRYDVRAFAQAYIDADPDSESSLHDGYESYTAAWKVHYQQVLAGLQDLYSFVFDITEMNSTFSWQFKTLMRSYHRSVRPVSRAADATLLNTQLREAGLEETFSAGMAQITQSQQKSAEAHLDIMTALLATMLGERSAKVFTSADLRAIGIDDTPPQRADHMHDAWENY